MPRPGTMSSLANVWRPSEAAGVLKTRETTMEVQPVPAWLSIIAAARSLADDGAGERPAGTMRGKAHRYVDLLPRDVLEIVGGPETGTAWRVMGITHPNDVETVADLVAFNGTLP